MSFMFNPFEYIDDNTVNHIDSSGLEMSKAVFGNKSVAESIICCDEKVIGIDGYATAQYDILMTLVEQISSLRNIPVTLVPTNTLWKDEKTINNDLTANYLPNDRVKDPVLLYGKLYTGKYEDLIDTEKLEKLIKLIHEFRKNGNGKLIVYGPGSLCETLAGLYDRRVWIDVTPLRAILNVKEGKYRNIGLKKSIAFKQAARRCYYVDFELAMASRSRLFQSNGIDYYVAGTNPDNMVQLPIDLLRKIFRRGLEYPFRCKPVYLAGVWGGNYIKSLRNLPEKLENCAWSFDLIPMEVSVVFDIDGKRLEFPFYDLVQAEGEKLMGKESIAHFGPYFPIRFNYDDTFHSNGNMSIQCHPTREYIRKENGEFDRQDESYYIVVTGQEAKTYLGFNENINVEDFIKDVRRSETEHTVVDYQKYVNAVESKPGVQVMIPAGTIHASGRNQVVLEIGSLTVGSYTYKMYDYLRLDLDGIPRPLHTYHGDKVLKRDRTTSWVNENIVQKPRTIRKGDDWEEYIVGEHDLLYFSLRNVRFISQYQDDTKGRFHVLSLVDGQKVLVRSLNNPDRYYEQNYLDIIVIPADMGPYEVINLLPGTTVTIHKTLLKDGFENAL